MAVAGHNIERHHAIQSLKPGAEWVLKGDVLEWLNDSHVKPTLAEIDAEVVRLQAEYDGKAYQRNRADEYPPIGDQLDDLFHKGAFSTEMAAKLQAVKTKHPKE